MNKKLLKDICKNISSGLTPLRSNKRYWNSQDIPWVKTEQLGDKHIYDSNEKISQYAFEDTSIKINPVNTISIAMYGEGQTRGRVSILKKEMTTNQACCNLVIDDKEANYEYVYYFLKNQYKQIRAFSSGVRKNLNSDNIKNLEIFLPSKRSYQNDVAKVLSEIDKKIEINNKIYSELEAMTKLIYDYWFVQFDFPDANGRPYKSSGGKMVFNNDLKQEIPEGWNTIPISSLLNIKTGKEDANFATSNGKYPFFTCGEKILNCDEYAFEGKAVLLAGNGTFSIKRYVGKFNAYQRTYVLIPNEESLFPHIYFAVKAQAQQLTDGSRGSIVKFITIGDIENINLVLPSDPTTCSTEHLNDLFDQSDALIKENEELDKLRDWLLTMLMNGQVTVSEAS